jgi:hypothetical protein
MRTMTGVPVGRSGATRDATVMRTTRVIFLMIQTTCAHGKSHRDFFASAIVASAIFPRLGRTSSLAFYCFTLQAPCGFKPCLAHSATAASKPSSRVCVVQILSVCVELRVPLQQPCRRIPHPRRDKPRTPKNSGHDSGTNGKFSPGFLHFTHPPAVL